MAQPVWYETVPLSFPTPEDLGAPDADAGALTGWSEFYRIMDLPVDAWAEVASRCATYTDILALWGVCRAAQQGVGHALRTWSTAARTLVFWTRRIATVPWQRRLDLTGVDAPWNQASAISPVVLQLCVAAGLVGPSPLMMALLRYRAAHPWSSFPVQHPADLAPLVPIYRALGRPVDVFMTAVCGGFVCKCHLLGCACSANRHRMTQCFQWTLDTQQRYTLAVTLRLRDEFSRRTTVWETRHVTAMLDRLICLELGGILPQSLAAGMTAPVREWAALRGIPEAPTGQPTTVRMELDRGFMPCARLCFITPDNYSIMHTMNYNDTGATEDEREALSARINSRAAEMERLFGH